jgi:divinyl protochlorophyllide a 8-vinyl-reductase
MTHVSASIPTEVGEAPPRARRPVGRIGPNAITRLAEALDRRHGTALTRDVFAAAHRTHYLDEPPSAMVDEADVIDLHRAARGLLGPPAFAEVARLAGDLTGRYILANRIPGPAQILLRRLPRGLAARLLTSAIARHSWTFVGSGRFSHAACREGLRLTVSNSPLVRDLVAQAPACDYYTATFERIFGALIGRDIRVSEVSCAATGAEACAFAVQLRAPR